MNEPRSPLTGTTKVRLLQAWTCKELAERWKADLGLDITPEFRGSEWIYLYACEESGLRFFAPTSVAGSPRFYQQLQTFSWYYMDEKWEYAAALRRIAGRRSVLEVGCGGGAFLALAEAAGHEVRGIDVNEEALAIAQQRGLTVENSVLSEVAQRYRGYFDAVCAFQVLEHVPEPLEFCRRLVELARPGGLAIVSVPNQDSFMGKAESILDFPPHHMTRWYPGSFQTLASGCSTTLHTVCREPLAPYHVDPFLATVGKNPRGDRLICLPGVRAVLRLLLLLGARRLVTGHTILAVLMKPA